MRQEVARDLSKSLNDLRRIVIPTLRKSCPEFGDTSFRVVESPDNTKDELRQDLDVLAGIDAYQRWISAMRGIASRVQFGNDYRTFTIRLSRPSPSGIRNTKTEYEKRLTAIKRKDEGFLYPYWTIQAYLTCVGGDLQSIGLARTDQLYLYIEEREKKKKFPRKDAHNGGETFLYVDWDSYRASGNYFFEYPEPATLLKERITFSIERMDQALSQSEDEEEEEIYTLADYEELYACELGMKAADAMFEDQAWDEIVEQGDNYPSSEFGGSEPEQPSWFAYFRKG